jgi:hypothetical protein
VGNQFAAATRGIVVTIPRIPRATILALFAAGCGLFGRPERIADLRPSTLPRSQVMLIFSHGTVRRWHGVVISSDSITGIPDAESARCERCRASVPRAVVDSAVLLGSNPPTAVMVISGVIVIAFILSGAK